MAASVCFVFTVTIGVFPAITAKVFTVLGEGNKWSKCGQGWGAVGGNWEKSKWEKRNWVDPGWTLDAHRSCSIIPPTKVNRREKT